MADNIRLCGEDCDFYRNFPYSKCMHTSSARDILVNPGDKCLYGLEEKAEFPRRVDASTVRSSLKKEPQGDGPKRFTG